MIAEPAPSRKPRSLKFQSRKLSVEAVMAEEPAAGSPGNGGRSRPSRPEVAQAAPKLPAAAPWSDRSRVDPKPRVPSAAVGGLWGNALSAMTKSDRRGAVPAPFSLAQSAAHVWESSLQMPPSCPRRDGRVAGGYPVFLSPCVLPIVPPYHGLYDRGGVGLKTGERSAVVPALFFVLDRRRCFC